MASLQRQFKACVDLRRELGALVQELHRSVGSLHRHIGLCDPSAEAGEISDEDLVEAVSEASRRLAKPFGDASRQGRARLRAALKRSNDQATHELIVRLIDAWLNFSTYDEVMVQVAASGASEFDVTVPIRVSPLDATHFVDETQQDENGAVTKLGGTNLHNFGGFLSADWRMNDFAWGRFDMAEMIVHHVLGCGSDETEQVTDAIFLDLVQRPDGDRETLGDPLEALLKVNMHTSSAPHLAARAALVEVRESRSGDAEKATVKAFRQLFGESDSSDAWNVSADLTVVDPESKLKSVTTGASSLVEVLRTRSKATWLRGSAEMLALASGAATTRRPAALTLLVWAVLIVGAVALVGFAIAASVPSTALSFAAVFLGAVVAWALARRQLARQQPVVRWASLGGLVALAGLALAGVISISATAMTVAAVQLVVLVIGGWLLKSKLHAVYQAIGKPKATTVER